MSKGGGRAGKPIPAVDVSSEYLEVERRRYHEQIQAELVRRGAIVDTQAVEAARGGSTEAQGQGVKWGLMPNLVTDLAFHKYTSPRVDSSALGVDTVQQIDLAGDTELSGSEARATAGRRNPGPSRYLGPAFAEAHVRENALVCRGPDSGCRNRTGKTIRHPQQGLSYGSLEAIGKTTGRNPGPLHPLNHPLVNPVVVVLTTFESDCGYVVSACIPHEFLHAECARPFVPAIIEAVAHIDIAFLVCPGDCAKRLQPSRVALSLPVKTVLTAKEQAALKISSDCACLVFLDGHACENVEARCDVYRLVNKPNHRELEATDLQGGRPKVKSLRPERYVTDLAGDSSPPGPESATQPTTQRFFPSAVRECHPACPARNIPPGKAPGRRRTPRTAHNRPKGQEGARDDRERRMATDR